jgi:hypothetical protein
VKIVYLGVPLEEFSRFRSRDEIAAARAELGIAPDEFAAGIRAMPWRGRTSSCTRSETCWRR